MGSFTVVGSYSNDDETPEQGVITVIPSVLPLVGSGDNNEVIASPILGKVDSGRVVIDLPSSDTFLPEFSLTWAVRLNSGFRDSFEFLPRPEGDLVPLSAVTHIPLPLSYSDEMQYSIEVLAARDAALAARDQILATPLPQDGFSAYQIAVTQGFTGTEMEWLESLKAPITIYPLQEVVDEVLEDLEPPIDITLLYLNAKI